VLDHANRPVAKLSAAAVAGGSLPEPDRARVAGVRRDFEALRRQPVVELRADGEWLADIAVGWEVLGQ
jgi:hypothetical protein